MINEWIHVFDFQRVQPQQPLEVHFSTQLDTKKNIYLETTTSYTIIAPFYINNIVINGVFANYSLLFLHSFNDVQYLIDYIQR